MSITAEDMRLLMERENKRQFVSVTRVWYQEKKQGRKPYRAIEEIGQEEFGYTAEEAHAISHSANYKVRRGKTSEQAVAEVLERWRKFEERKAA